jgi:hypothetical protein
VIQSVNCEATVLQDDNIVIDSILVKFGISGISPGIYNVET